MQILQCVLYLTLKLNFTAFLHGVRITYSVHQDEDPTLELGLFPPWASCSL